jgi:hypothetical protein
MDGQTDRHGQANICILQFLVVNTPKNTMYAYVPLLQAVVDRSPVSK